ncbi:hypothetical protein [Stenotrophomonas sp. 24(2023)]|uniref:hypothetical protein n=1 Tax=Stenotrophomonas sp. 24(2023) TaxID=3068324 RepID=UPI0027E17356|nr:hypothetical protein [Stenotrophomonas sp. 24(2023)]WMJ68398.1 hypothetical protein Q9R17_14510 [Stenotrophomonas sp. 24(2023)]
MNESAAPSNALVPPPGDGDAQSEQQAGAARFERVRDRTDELELFLSGLLAFALLAVPDRLFDLWASSSAHTAGLHFHALTFAFSTAVGMCYVLALALIAHLAVRAYWIGLIGLKSHFPKGVDWDRLKSVGPVTRAFYQRQGSGLDGAIGRADRLSSLLFSGTLICVLTLAGSLVLGIVSLAMVGLLGAAFGNVDRIAMGLVAVIFIGAALFVMLPILLEKRIARSAALGRDTTAQRQRLEWMLAAQQRMPMLRLLQSMQLTLQSNLKGHTFSIVYLLGITFAMSLGALQIVGSMKFSLFNRYTVVTEDAVDNGMLSAHYESLRSPHDQLLRLPMIPADTISSSQLRLFIPHRPQRDNALASERCTALPGGDNRAHGPAAATLATQCLALLWTVTLDGVPVDLAGFMPMERRDLDMRGLVGYLPMAGLAPGRHDLALTWNAAGGAKGVDRARDYRIPFWYAPGP